MFTRTKVPFHPRTVVTLMYDEIHFNVTMVLFNRVNRYLISLCPKNCNKNGQVFSIKFFSNKSPNEVTVESSNGKEMTLTTGKFARLANGCVTAKSGETTIMTTVVRSSEPVTKQKNETLLTVDYRHRAAAAGRIPTNFLRKELAQSEYEILASRVIDRSLRPMFINDFCYDTQVVCKLVAADGVHDEHVLAINAASAALSISDIPWHGPVGAVKVGLINEQIVINPSKRELQQSKLNLTMTCTPSQNVVMLEGFANEISEIDMRKGIKAGIVECMKVISNITKLQEQVGKPKITIERNEECTGEVYDFIKGFIESKLHDIFTCYTHDKLSRDCAVSDVRKEMLNRVKEDFGETSVEKASSIFNIIAKTVFRNATVNTRKRCDGRSFDKIRPMECEVDLFKPLHGSAYFQRGQTQVLCTVTLDSIESSLKLDPISTLTSGMKEKNFFVHYEFPPYAVNEIGRVAGTNRREIGHGALAEKGLRTVIPKDYPFAIRVTSEVLESNGSSSMATVCAGSLALMNAGVPISEAVAGVAMGLIVDDTTDESMKQWHVLTDIAGIEDHFGDMDFKIAGTKNGITVLQADFKIPGIPINVLWIILQKAQSARNRILLKMNETINSPVSHKRENSPVLESLEVPVHLRSRLIGLGGINMKRIFHETGATVSQQDGAQFSIFAPSQNALKEAKEMIAEILKEEKEPTLTFGNIYTATITEVRSTGVMVTLYPTMIPVLLPNSQLDQRKIVHPSALGLNVGDKIQLKYFGRDPVNGQVRLSRKVLQEPISFKKDFTESQEVVETYKT